MKRMLLCVATCLTLMTTGALAAIGAPDRTMNTLDEITLASPVDMAFAVPDKAVGDGHMLVMEAYALDTTEPVDTRHLLRIALVFDLPVSDRVPTLQVHSLAANLNAQRYRPPIE